MIKFLKRLHYRKLLKQHLEKWKDDGIIESYKLKWDNRNRRYVFSVVPLENNHYDDYSDEYIEEITTQDF